ncbi:MAG: VanZ family protein [Campylobacterota bacterium]|nr:VanZ family protein [Campylobacterota bacterium]
MKNTHLPNTLFYSMLLGIFLFAFLPGDTLPKMLHAINPDLKHIVAFFVISLYVYHFKHWQIVGIGLFCLGFGLFIEIGQGLFTSREFSLHDLLYDVVGYGVFLIYVLIYKLFYRD